MRVKALHVALVLIGVGIVFAASESATEPASSSASKKFLLFNNTFDTPSDRPSERVTVRDYEERPVSVVGHNPMTVPAVPLASARPKVHGPPASYPHERKLIPSAKALRHGGYQPVTSRKHDFLLNGGGPSKDRSAQDPTNRVDPFQRRDLYDDADRVRMQASRADIRTQNANFVHPPRVGTAWQRSGNEHTGATRHMPVMDRVGPQIHGDFVGAPSMHERGARPDQDPDSAFHRHAVNPAHTPNAHSRHQHSATNRALNDHNNPSLSGSNTWLGAPSSTVDLAAPQLKPLVRETAHKETLAQSQYFGQSANPTQAHADFAYKPDRQLADQQQRSMQPGALLVGQAHSQQFAPGAATVAQTNTRLKADPANQFTPNGAAGINALAQPATNRFRVPIHARRDPAPTNATNDRLAAATAATAPSHPTNRLDPAIFRAQLANYVRNRSRV